MSRPSIVLCALGALPSKRTSTCTSMFQTGADVTVTVLDPTGAVFRRVDGSGVENTLETISWTDSAAGTYTVRLHVQERVAHGRFQYSSIRRVRRARPIR